jgi:hypothetical protein
MKTVITGTSDTAFRHCDPTDRANARPMTGSAKQSISAAYCKHGLLRRFAPRNDDGYWENTRLIDGNASVIIEL